LDRRRGGVGGVLPAQPRPGAPARRTRVRHPAPHRRQSAPAGDGGAVRDRHRRPHRPLGGPDPGLSAPGVGRRAVAADRPGLAGRLSGRQARPVAAHRPRQRSGDRLVTASGQLTVRPATPADHEAIGALTVAVYVGEGYVPPDSPYAAELADTARRAEVATLLVAEHEGEVIGSLTVARPGTPYADIARPGELEFRMLAVAVGARGLGAGTTLVRSVIEIARAESLAAVVLT